MTNPFVLLFSLSIIALLLLPPLATPQESLTITTYYPSPNGAFNELVVRKKAAIGNISQSSNPDIDTMEELSDGQLYIADSLIIMPIAGTAQAGTAKPGQMVYTSSGPTGNIQFYNGTWIKTGE